MEKFGSFSILQLTNPNNQNNDSNSTHKPKSTSTCSIL